MNYPNKTPPPQILICIQQGGVSDFKQASRFYLVCLIIMYVNEEAYSLM